MELKKIKIPFRKIGQVLLFLLATALLGGAGYMGVSLAQEYLGREAVEYQKANSQVYKSETYHLGMRYPLDWEVEEVKPTLAIFTPAVEEGEAKPREYLSLKVSAAGKRGPTGCEKDQAACSFHANGIFGDRISTPDEETVFFSKNGSDFTITLHRYSAEVDFLPVFEGLTESLRFTSAAEAGEDGEGEDEGN